MHRQIRYATATQLAYPVLLGVVFAVLAASVPACAQRQITWEYFTHNTEQHGQTTSGLVVFPSGIRNTTISYEIEIRRNTEPGDQSSSEPLHFAGSVEYDSHKTRFLIPVPTKIMSAVMQGKAQITRISLSLAGFQSTVEQPQTGVKYVIDVMD